MAKAPKVFISIPIVISAILLGFNFIQGSTDEGEVIKLIVGEAKIISTRAPTRVVIGNPQVADIGDVSNTEISLTAKAPGVTTLIYWDAFGEQSVKIRVVSEDMEEIKRRVDNLLNTLKLPNVYTQASDEEGKVIILGQVKYPEDRERITTALGEGLKGKIVDLVQVKEEEKTVEIDVQVLELDRDATNTLGFSWPGNITLTEQGSPALDASAQTQVGSTSTIAGGAALGTKWSTLFKVLNLSRNQFSFSLDALIQTGKARILSRPRLACQSGKEASLLVGGEKPILTTSTVLGGGAETTVEYKEFGIKLKIKPTVNEENRIKVSLNVEVSDIGDADILGPANAPTAKAYPLTKRTASTELFLDDGQTLGIGGLIRQKTEEDIRKVPWLADVPVLGLFFRKTTTRKGGGIGVRGDTELFISLTPTIVNPKNEHLAKPALKKAVSIEVTPEMTNLPPEVANYVRAVQAKIINAIHYPQQAKSAGWGGNVKLNINLAANGSLKDIKLMQSSGYKVLDDAALDIAKEQSPYPPFPPQIESQELWVVIPVVYKKD